MSLPLGAYGLSIVAILLYVATHIASAVAGWVEFADEATQHGQVTELLGDSGYAWTFLEQTLQNWQSEFLALTLLVALSAVLLHRGSEQSRDGQDELQQRIEAVQKRVDALVDGRRARQRAGS